MATAEFAFNNKVHIVTKTLPFQVNCGKELRIGFDIRKKRKNEKVEEFAREMKKRHEEARAALVRSREEMKKQTDRKTKEYRVGDKVLISMKNFLMELMKRATKKLMKNFIGLYMVKKIVLENVVELELPASLQIHLVVNVRRIVKYRKQVEEQREIPLPPVEVAGEKEYVIEEILDR